MTSLAMHRMTASRPSAADGSPNRLTARRPSAADGSSNRLSARRPTAADGSSGGASSSQITPSVGYFAALSPFLHRVCHPEDHSPADIVIDDDIEEPQVLAVPEKRPPRTDAERARKCRVNKKQRVDEAKILLCDRENLLICIRRRCLIRNQYT